MDSTDYDYSFYYSQYHDESDEHAELMSRQFQDLLKAHVPDDRSANILDVGCGYGFAIRALRALGFHSIQGIEQSSTQAERCTRAGFNVIVPDNTLDWLSDQKHQFDLILLLDVIEHIATFDQIRFLRALHTTLRPGGQIILTTPNANSILASRWRYNDYTHHSSFTEHSLNFVLRNAGFTSIQIDSNKGIGRFPGCLWRRSTWPAVRRWLVRWCWLQVFKAELPWERIDDISFELNLKAVAQR